jgi:hypothetical protein
MTESRLGLSTPGSTVEGVALTIGLVAFFAFEFFAFEQVLVRYEHEIASNCIPSAAFGHSEGLS